MVWVVGAHNTYGVKAEILPWQTGSYPSKINRINVVSRTYKLLDSMSDSAEVVFLC